MDNDCNDTHMARASHGTCRGSGGRRGRKSPRFLWCGLDVPCACEIAYLARTGAPISMPIGSGCGHLIQSFLEFLCLVVVGAIMIRHFFFWQNDCQPIKEAWLDLRSEIVHVLAVITTPAGALPLLQRPLIPR